MLSEKGKNLFMRDEFKFWFHKTLANNVQRWACTEKKCTAFLKISAGIIINDANADVHNYDPVEESSLVKQRIGNALKRKAVDDMCERPSKMIACELDSQALQVMTGKYVIEELADTENNDWPDQEIQRKLEEFNRTAKLYNSQ